MRCDICEVPFRQGDEVVQTVHGQIVDGKFVQTEEDRIEHEECPE